MGQKIKKIEEKKEETEKDPAATEAEGYIKSVGSSGGTMFIKLGGKTVNFSKDKKYLVKEVKINA